MKNVMYFELKRDHPIIYWFGRIFLNYPIVEGGAEYY